ncbi:TPA: hypothetical protein R0C45_003799 [Kluyvera ascorbata F0526]|nr:hypothetical protein [Kluyvera ascorbata F0526]
MTAQISAYGRLVTDALRRTQEPRPPAQGYEDYDQTPLMMIKLHSEDAENE